MYMYIGKYTHAGNELLLVASAEFHTHVVEHPCLMPPKDNQTLLQPVEKLPYYHIIGGKQQRCSNLPHKSTTLAFF